MTSKIARKLLIACTLLIVLFFAFQNRASARFQGGTIPPGIPGEVVYIPFPVVIELDGQLDDWADIPTTLVDYGPYVFDDPAENGSFTFALAADTENLYITMQMPDQNIIAGQHDLEFWNEDSFEFYINASADPNASAYGAGIYQININAADIGNTDPDALTITGVNSQELDVRGFVFLTEDGWGFEAAIPLTGLITPVHGAEMGFQAQINGASQLDRNVKLIWGKEDLTDESYQYPYLFGRALFFELGRSDIPTASLVEVPPTPTPTPAPGAMISLNQVGYFPDSEKIASYEQSNRQELTWQLRDRSGVVLLEGAAQFKGEDAASGSTLYSIDFSEFDKPGVGYQIRIGAVKSQPFDIGEGIYSHLKTDALAYFYYNRSGTPIEAKYAGETWARPAGHVTDNNVTCFKGVDADGKEWPGCDYTLDVSWGWYDAGDFGKYVVNGGISVWTLLDLYERFPEAFADGSLKIPENHNGVPDLLDETRWEMEFILAMQVPEGEPQAGMVHHKMHDLAWAGMPMVPPSEVDNNNSFAPNGQGRYLYPPSTAATLNLAATGAQCSRVWAEIDPAFSSRCLSAAETAWRAAMDNPLAFAGNTPGAGGGNYGDNSAADEFYWAAAELYITTGGSVYLDFMLDSGLFPQASSFDWGSTAALGTISLAVAPNKLPEDQVARLHENLVASADELLKIQMEDGYLVPIRGDYPWGSNSLVLNNAILMGLAHDLTGEAKYLDGVRWSMDYILGHNALNKSFVSGYGEFPMEHPHHRFWANEPEKGYPPPPPGALSGGPNSSPSDTDAIEAGIAANAPAKRYLDTLGSFSTNEVTINWNAPLAWVATYLDEKRERQPAEGAEEALEPGVLAATPAAVSAPVIGTPPASEPQNRLGLWVTLIAGMFGLVILGVVVARSRNRNTPD